jgi:prophage regulatory protein
LKNTAQSPRLLPWPEVERRVPYTRQWAYKLEKQGLFPRHVQVGPNRVAWLETEVDAWIEARAAERGQAAA